MTTEIIVSVLSAARPSTNFTPTESVYFTAVQGNIYIAHHLPENWRVTGYSVTGQPYRNSATITLPDYISDTHLDLR